jgi:hypothetical protein
VVVGAPQLTENPGVEVGIVRDVARLGAEHGDLGAGQPVGNEAAIHGGGHRPDALADDHDLVRVGQLLGEVVERRRAVHEAPVLDSQTRRVSPGGVAKVRVTGA